jgi:hypothetical protein
VTRAAAALDLDVDEFLDQARQRLGRADAKKDFGLVGVLNRAFARAHYEADRLTRLDRGIVEAVGYDPELGATVHTHARIDDLAEEPPEAAISEAPAA